MLGYFGQIMKYILNPLKKCTSVTRAQPLLPEIKRAASHVPSHSGNNLPADNLKMSRALFLGDIYLEEVNTCSGHCLYNRNREHVPIIFLTAFSFCANQKNCDFAMKTIFSPILDQFPCDKPCGFSFPTMLLYSDSIVGKKKSKV